MVAHLPDLLDLVQDLLLWTQGLLQHWGGTRTTVTSRSPQGQGHLKVKVMQVTGPSAALTLFAAHPNLRQAEPGSLFILQETSMRWEGPDRCMRWEGPDR